MIQRTSTAQLISWPAQHVHRHFTDTDRQQQAELVTRSLVLS